MALEAVRLEWRRSPVAWRWARVVRATLQLLSTLTERVAKQKWIRFRVDLAFVALASDCATLRPIDEEILRKIEAHVDGSHPDVRAAMMYWNLGLRGGFIWMRGDEPLCMQWLFTAEDNAALARLPSWSGMYQPLAQRAGQLEKLWTFSTAREKGIATQFATAMFETARERGLTHLQTNICESNVAARKWAARTGWLADGTITRYHFDLPGLRENRTAIYVHESGVAGEAASLPGQREGDVVEKAAPARVVRLDVRTRVG